MPTPIVYQDNLYICDDRGILTVEQVEPEVVFRAQKRVIVPSADLKSRYHACRIAGFPAKPPKQGRFRVRSFLTYALLMLNDKLSKTRLGPKILGYIPRPLLYAYIASIKIINTSLGTSKSS